MTPIRRSVTFALVTLALTTLAAAPPPDSAAAVRAPASVAAAVAASGITLADLPRDALLLAPIEGITTGWHLAPAETAIPLGRRVRLLRAVHPRVEVRWQGATEIARQERWSMAEVLLEQAGDRVVGVDLLLPNGQVLQERSVLRPVEVEWHQVRLTPIRVRRSRQGADGVSVAALRPLGQGRFRTAVDTPLELTVEVEPAAFAPLVEWYLDGRARLELGPAQVVSFQGTGEHTVSAGPPATRQEVAVESYRVTIERQSALPRGPAGAGAAVFQARTDPPGHAAEVTWRLEGDDPSAPLASGHGERFAPSMDGSHSSLTVRADSTELPLAVSEVEDGLLSATELLVSFDPDDSSCLAGSPLSFSAAGLEPEIVSREAPPYFDGQVIATETRQLAMAAFSTELGYVELRQPPSLASPGFVEVLATAGGELIDGVSHLELLVELELTDLGQILDTGGQPLSLIAPIASLPALGALHLPLASDPVQLFDQESGVAAGWLCDVTYTPQTEVPPYPPPTYDEDWFESTGHTTVTVSSGFLASIQPLLGRALGDVTLDVPLSSEGFAPAEVRRDPAPYEPGQDIHTEMTQLELHGFSEMVGEVIVRERGDRVSRGTIRDVVVDGDGEFLSGESWFDLFLEIELPELGVTYHTGTQPVLVTSGPITRLPPEGGQYEHLEDYGQPRLYDRDSFDDVGTIEYGNHIVIREVDCCWVDLDIDSDNNNGLAPPDRSSLEDAIEAFPPGKLICLNDDDDNLTGLPDLLEEPIWPNPPEDDPVFMWMELRPNTPPGNWRLTYTPNVEVYDLDQGWPYVIIPSGAVFPVPLVPNPKLVKVEGVQVSQAMGDAVLILDYDCDGDQAFDRTDFVVATVVKLDLDIHKPPVIDPTQPVIPEAQERTVGAQTWVNLDNDDRDTLYDTGTNDTAVAGEDEMAKVVLRIEPANLNVGALVLSAVQGGANVKVWKSATKGTEYVLGTPLAIPQEFQVVGNALVKELWVEGISAHTAQQGTVLRLTYNAMPAQPCFDEVALTVLGVKDQKWLGKQNGFTGGSDNHDSNTLDQDPNYGAGSNRVFPGGRAGSFATARDDVELEVELTVAPVEAVDLFLRSFDADDPSTETDFVDPNDNGGAGMYSGTTINYDADEDNRGEVGGDKAGQLMGQDANDVLALRFNANQNKRKVDFTVSLHPGDSYRGVANGDRDFVLEVRNRDQDDGARLVDPAVAAPVANREVRMPDDYTTDVLSVWRLLHVERDSMVAVPAMGNERNVVTGNITAIASGGAPAVARRATLDVDLTAPPGGADASPNLTGGAGNGRFENGTFTLGATANNPLDGNGDDFVQLNAGLTIPFTLVPPPPPPPPPPPAVPPPPLGNVTGNVLALAGNVFTLDVTGGALAAGHNNGTLTVGGAAMAVNAVNVGASQVTVAALGNIAFTLIDDDSGMLPHNVDLTGLNAYNAAYLLPVVDGGGAAANNDQNVPFLLNTLGTSAGQVAVYNASRGSAGNENDEFWVVYVCAGWQYREARDNDPDAESSVSGINSPFGATHNINLAVGGEGGMIWRETELDLVNEGSWPGIGREARNVAHEIGHQFGLGHGNAASAGGQVMEWPAMGLMHPTLSAAANADDLIPRHLNLIRSRTASPGN